MAESVVDPQGRRWVVRRRWMPRLGVETLWGRFRRRFRRVFDRVGDAADVDPGCAEVLGEGIAVALVVIIVVLALFFVVIPLLVAIVDVLILLLLTVAGAAARVLFRRPWTVEASADDGTTLRWRVVGWRSSGEQCVRIGQRLQAGLDPDV
jgi:hypothetical protein